MNDNLPSLDELARKIEAAKPEPEKDIPSQRAPEGVNLAMRLMVELVSAAGVGGLVGWWLDGQFNTTPWLFITLFLMGAVGGFLTIFRTMGRGQE